MGDVTTTNNRIYRKPDCPWGKRAIALLREKNIAFEDHIFSSKVEEEAFKAQHGVSTTPQIFFGNERIGGYTDLAKKYGVDPTAASEAAKTSYVPVAALFATAALIALACGGGAMEFMGIALCLLALQKLMDLRAFLVTFEKYDLFTRALPPYGKAYPFLELAVGLCFLAGVAPVVTGVVATILGTAGGISIFKAVYLEKRTLHCGCVGGNSRVPLGFVSFLENAVMAAMGMWSLVAGLSV